MPVLVEDRALLEAFRAGDKRALQRVYEFYFDDVYRLAALGFVNSDGKRIGRIEREADRLDFLQDVFVRAFSKQARESYDGLRPYRPFLLRIARNLRVDRARQQNRDPSASPRLVDDALHIDELIDQNLTLPSPHDAEADATWQRLLHETASIVSELEQDLQQLAQLRFVEELSQADTAAKLGTTRRRVRTLEGRLMRSVRRGLSRLGLSPEKK
ncbi:MAG TPA: sigma-70 family RNA polymerase sigma factor [Polyangiaceae bacterium]|nr:sigma-70 family RNA polymerase sigma factor [Polyangiaceae bacterium]